jgi:hypothetical protein
MEHLGPILRLSAASARVDGEDRVQRIMLAREQCARLEFFEDFSQRVDFSLEVGSDIFAFARKVEEGGDVLRPALEFRVRGERLFETLALSHRLLGLLGVAPEIRGRDLLFDLVELGLYASRVKDTPAGL